MKFYGTQIDLLKKYANQLNIHLDINFTDNVKSAGIRSILNKIYRVSNLSSFFLKKLKEDEFSDISKESSNMIPYLALLDYLLTNDQQSKQIAGLLPMHQILDTAIVILEKQPQYKDKFLSLFAEIHSSQNNITSFNRKFWFTPKSKLEKFSKHIPKNICFLKDSICYADCLDFNPDIRNALLKEIYNKTDTYESLINFWIDKAISNIDQYALYGLASILFDINNTVNINSILDNFTRQTKLFDPHNVLKLNDLTDPIKEKFIFERLFQKPDSYFISIYKIEDFYYLNFFLSNLNKHQKLYIRCVHNELYDVLECLTQYSKPEHVYIVTASYDQEEEYINDYYQFLVEDKLSKIYTDYSNTLIQPIKNEKGITVFEIIETQIPMIPNELERVKHIIDTKGFPKNYDVAYFNILLKEEKINQIIDDVGDF